MFPRSLKTDKDVNHFSVMLGNQQVNHEFGGLLLDTINTASNLLDISDVFNHITPVWLNLHGDKIIVALHTAVT